jgi:hypothetical protein
MARLVKAMHPSTPVGLEWAGSRCYNRTALPHPGANADR